MGDSKDDAKAAKKAAKAATKQQKKSAGSPETLAPVGEQPSRPESTATSTSGSTVPPTPAERSAIAAERQVRLQRLRVYLALAALFVALATFLITTTPWKTGSDDAAKPATPTTTQSIP